MPRTVVYSEGPRSKPKDHRLYNPSHGSEGTRSPSWAAQASSDWSIEANRSQVHSYYHPRSPSQTVHHHSASAPIHPTKPAATLPHQPGIIELQGHDTRYQNLFLQPDSRPISQEQLASEVKSIYAGLNMVETKCIHVNRAQAAALQDESDSDSELVSDHWQALITLHKTLLHEHHDSFLASQHPSASPALRRLAAKYSMPARMGKHDIHSFLALLRRGLPESIDHMLAFTDLAYEMMAFLYETVSAFKDTCIEYLDDLSRYLMALEDEDFRVRETWPGVARSWGRKGADENPQIGRLCHHLTTLARPNHLQQLYYYARSFSSVRHFPLTRVPILAFPDPALGCSNASYSHRLLNDTSFIQARGVLFRKFSDDRFEDGWSSFLGQLNEHIRRSTYIHAKLSELKASRSNLMGVFSELLTPVDMIQRAGSVQQRIFSKCLKTFTAITALSLLPSVQAARSHISATGIPVTNTFAGALAWIISCFQDGRTVSTFLYWVVYGCWVLATLLAVGFTASSIAQGHRLRYVGVVVLMGGLIFAALVASSVGNVEQMWEHIKTWMPMASVLVAGALPMAFDRVE